MFKILFPLVAVIVSAFSIQAQYAGRYSDGKDYAVYFEQTKYGLTIRPVMWTATQLLREAGKDKFEVVDRTSRGAEFLRDSSAHVVGVKIRGMDGEGLKLRRENGPVLPLELLLSDQARKAAAGYLRFRKTEQAIEIAEQVLHRVPTKTRTVLSFFHYLAPSFENSARFHTVLGYALVQAGDRKSALASFRRAYKLDPQNEETLSGLARLGGLPQGAPNDHAWKLPFSLSSVFATPTANEIAEVEKDWATRDLDPSGVREEFKSIVTIADRKFEVRIVSHLVHGLRHYGAIISPPNARGKRLPVIIEAKGVSPTYFPLSLEGLASPRMMGEFADKFIYVVPTFRGEVLNFDGSTFTSEGDRTDALDGATDDAIALLNVALESTPEVDPTRICAFGHSRGGTVAMLVGIRDRRVDCVVNWAGPTDWFYAMGTEGWTEQELWQEGFRIGANTQQTGGQNIERFLSRALSGKESLKDVRHRMIASSPLYFAHRLPDSEHHYGLEDTSVPVRNGLELVARLRARGIPHERHHAFFYRGQGHDTDRIRAPISSAKFIVKVLGVGN